MANLLNNPSLWTRASNTGGFPAADIWDEGTYQSSGNTSFKQMQMPAQAGTIEGIISHNYAYDINAVVLVARVAGPLTGYPIETPTIREIYYMEPSQGLSVEHNVNITIDEFLEDDYIIISAHNLDGNTQTFPANLGYGFFEYIESADFIPTPTVPYSGFHVYELERGWSFDGRYIEHFLEVNWYFGDSPVTYTTIQKVRVHGLTKGNVQLQVAANGMQTTYLNDFTSDQYIDLKSPYEYVSSDFYPTTETTDLENRGLAIQLKFSGRGDMFSMPEPSHVLQVLVVQSSPDGTGFTAN